MSADHAGHGVMLRRWVARIAPVVLLSLAGWVLWREFRSLTVAQVVAKAQLWGAQRIAIAGVLTVCSFTCLALIERLGLNWAHAKAPWRVALLAGFCANAFAHAIGFALLTGSTVRTRFYARHGASILAAAQVGLFRGVAFGTGMSTVLGLALMGSPDLDFDGWRPDAVIVRGVACGFLLAPVVYLGLCTGLRGSVTLFGRVLALPPPGAAAAQVALGAVDCASTAMIGWALLPGGLASYGQYAAAYAVSTLLGLASHVPGGFGVFEGSVLTLLPQAPRAALAAAFLGYRLIYYVTPLAIASLLLVADGYADRRSAHTHKDVMSQ